MIDINDKEHLHRYLFESGLVTGEDIYKRELLSGGVSCKVVKITTGTRSFVIKQALPKLKVKDDWFSDIRRILIERDCLRVLENIIPEDVPGFITADDDNYLYVMEAAPTEAQVWKTQLLQGKLDFHVAEKVGLALAKVHSVASRNNQIKEKFRNQQIFKELRINPYLETIRDKHTSLKKEIDSVISMLLDNKLTLVHGDFSPKNILVHDENIYLLDYEVAHLGHPSFDLGFVTNHLLLKSIKNKRWASGYMSLMLVLVETYLSNIDFIDRKRMEKETIRVLALLFLARVDGKSPAEYITHENDKQLIRNISYIISESATSYQDVAQMIIQNITNVKRGK